MRRPHEGHAHSLPGPEADKRIGIEELRDALLDGGYTGDERKAWVKQVLNELQREGGDIPEEERRRLIAEVKRIIAQEQETDPLSKDIL